MFNNLRSLMINRDLTKDAIKLFLPKMKSLTSLGLPCDDNEYLDYIYTECKSLHTLKLHCVDRDNILV
jgi:hypothetical protein